MGLPYLQAIQRVKQLLVFWWPKSRAHSKLGWGRRKVRTRKDLEGKQNGNRVLAKSGANILSCGGCMIDHKHTRRNWGRVYGIKYLDVPYVMNINLMLLIVKPFIFWHLNDRWESSICDWCDVPEGCSSNNYKGLSCFYIYKACQIHIAEDVGNSLWILEVFTAQKYFTKIKCSDVFFPLFSYECV